MLIASLALAIARLPCPWARASAAAVSVAIGFVFALLLGCVATTTAAGAPDERLVALGAEYRQLQNLKGHFDGASWTEAIDRWGGRKHELMQELRTVLASRPATTRRQVLGWLGEPDAQWRFGQPPQRLLPPELRELKPGQSILWYSWRGTRDGLALLFSSGRGADDPLELIAWSYAGE